MSNGKKKNQRIVATNRKARHEYFIDDTYEAGLVLRGTEVKSLRSGHASLVDSYASVADGEAWLHNCHIAPYEQGNRFNVESKRSRKLLLHSREIAKLAGLSSQKGMTLVPLKIYFSGSYAKVQIGVCRGKKTYDKRQAIKERDIKRQMDREIRERI